MLTRVVRQRVQQSLQGLGSSSLVLRCKSLRLWLHKTLVFMVLKLAALSPLIMSPSSFVLVRCSYKTPSLWLNLPPGCSPLVALTVPLIATPIFLSHSKVTLLLGHRVPPA